MRYELAIIKKNKAVTMAHSSGGHGLGGGRRLQASELLSIYTGDY